MTLALTSSYADLKSDRVRNRSESATRPIVISSILGQFAGHFTGTHATLLALMEDIILFFVLEK